jgi:hypothetical protein
MFGLLYVGGYEASAVKGTRFPILAVYAFSWDPVTGLKPPKMDGPPRGLFAERTRRAEFANE